MPNAADVLAFLGRPGDTALSGVVENAIPIVTVMVKAYTRGNGFDIYGDTDDPDLEAVIVSAAARMASNPTGLAYDETAGPFSRSIRGAFNGWTLGELAVLNRYRVRAQ